MSCNAMDLSAYADGELPAVQARAVEAHVASCASCATELADLRALAVALLAEPAPPVSAAAVERTVQAARASVRRPSVWRSLERFWHARVSVPAPVLALGLVVVLILSRSEPEPKKVRLAIHQTWDAGSLWERPAEPRVLYHESVKL